MTVLHLKINARLRLLQAALLAICLLHNTHAADRPNIIFILCDDLGYGDTGAFFQKARQTAANRSEPWMMTPQLDTIATEGLQLRSHYCPAPVCAPSRASLLLGTHQGHANVRNNQFDKALADNHTLATVLKGAGYATACVGKWGLQGSGGSPAAWPAYPTNRGFDYYFGYVGHGDGHEHYPKEGLYSGAKKVYDGNTEVSAQLDKCYTTDLFTARSKKWITDHQTATPTQPFFLYLALDTPHAVLELPTQAYPAGGGLTGGLQWTGTSGAMINTASGTIDSFYHPAYATATWDHDNSNATAEQAWPDVYKRYATCVRRIDDAMGDLVKTLKDLNIDSNTLIVFTTDNGPSKESYLPESYDPSFFNSFGPFDGIKRDVWEGGIRVGATVRWPAGVPANRVSNLPCQSHDWMPTFAELAGTPVPAVSDGTSLVPTLKNTGTQKPPQVYVEYYESGTTPNYPEFLAAHRSRRRNQMQALRVGDFVGVRYNITSATDAFEIYNIVSDPQQATNLASSQASLQQQMKDTVLRLRRPDSSAARPYDSALVPPINPAPVTGGITWKEYANTHSYLADLLLATPAATGTTARPDISVRSQSNDVALLFSGYLQIPTDGTYTFFLNTDTRAFLRIHEASVIDADFGYVGGTEKSASIALKAGKHPFRLSYARGTGGSPALSLQWQGPTFARQAIPDAIFLRDGTGGGNVPPTAVDDQVKTTRNAAIQISPLANDGDDGTPQALSISSYTTPPSGTVTKAGNVLTYTPKTGFLGEDRFSYTITDGSSQATATIFLSVGYVDTNYWFPLDETSGLIANEAGAFRTATLSGFTNDPAQWIEGNTGRALNFDGVDDFLTIDGFTGILGTNARTISAWVKTNSTGANRPIVAWGANSNSNKWTFLMNTVGQIRLEVTNGIIVGTRSVNDGSWHHVACTFSGSNVTDVKLYVDGALETPSSTTALTINTTASGNVKIGSDIQNRFWQGGMDDVRIYPRALSAAEVTALATGRRHSADAWQKRYYGPTAAAWSADTDGDGMSSLLEFALDKQPQLPDGPATLEMTLVDLEAWEITVRQRAAAFGLAFKLELSTNLTSWSSTDVTTDTPIPDGADPAFESVTYTFPHLAPKQFCRLQATLP